MKNEQRMTRRKIFKESAKSIGTLIKLQFRAGVKLPRGKKTVRSLLKMILLLAGAVVLLGGFIAVYYILASQFIRVNGTDIDLSKEFLTFTLGGFMVLQTLFLIPMLIKVLDLNNDRELLLKLPVSSRQIFISKIVVAYLFEIVFAAVVLTPILIAFGLAAEARAVFYGVIPFLLLFVPVPPFFLATLVIFPAIKVVRFMRNRSLLTILCYFAGLVSLIVLYMQIVHGAVFAIADKGFAGALEKNADAIRSTASYIYPPGFFAGLLDPHWNVALLNAVWILSSSAAFIVIAFVAAGAQYKKIYMDERATHSGGYGRKGVCRTERQGTAVLKKDIINIFRSSNYTFQFLLIVVITPLLVYFCNRTAAYSISYSVHNTNVGGIDATQDMVFGVSLLVIMILIPLAACFAASNISREGYNIYHTKLIPVSFRKQLLIKAGIVFIPIVLSVTVSCGLAMLDYRIAQLGHTVRGLNAGEMLTVLGTAVLMSAGYICLGTYLDLKRPVCNQIGAQELTKSTPHINFIMLLGVVIGAGFGILGMFGGFAKQFFKVDFSGASLKLFYIAASAAFAAVSACLLFIDGPRKYHRLEQ